MKQTTLKQFKKLISGMDKKELIELLLDYKKDVDSKERSLKVASKICYLQQKLLYKYEGNDEDNTKQL